MSLLALSVVAVVVIALFGVSLSESPPIETKNLTTEQLDECRAKLIINQGIEIEGLYYLYTPGFLDSSLECRLIVKGGSLSEIFDMTRVNPLETSNQTIEPGKHLKLEIEQVEFGEYRINGFWFET